jgi:hypothetical protein
MKYIRSLLASFLLCITGCCGPKVEDYAGKTPALDVRDFMNGDLEAWGAFFNRSGTADPRFYVRMTGDFTQNEGTFKEIFTYDDGHRQKREWHFIFKDDHHFTGTADDVVGIAEGKQYGNAVNMKYTLRVKTESGKTYDMAMDDWLYLTDDKHLINRTTMSKLGFKVGELFIGFNKLD